MVRAAAVDNPKAYDVYDLDGGGTVHLRHARRPTSLELVPTRPLRSGKVCIRGDARGHVRRPDFDYFRVVGASGRSLRSARTRTGHAPQIAARSAAARCSAARVPVRSAPRIVLVAQPRAAQKLFWAAGFLCFAVAAASEAVAFRHGWSAGLFRSYYVCGGILTVSYLGAGSAWLLLPRRARDVMLGVLLVAHRQRSRPCCSRRSTRLRSLPSAACSRRRTPRSAATPSSGPSASTLPGRSRWSAARCSRSCAVSACVPMLWIASGALCVAAATGLSRAGDTSLVYVGELVGLALMFCGFTLPAPRVGRSAAPRAAVVTR